MNILYLLLFYPPTKFCQLDTEGHGKTQSTFIRVIVLKAIQLCLNASVILSFLWKPLLHHLHIGDRADAAFHLPTSPHSTKSGM